MSNEVDLLRELLGDPQFAELARKKAQELGVNLDESPPPSEQQRQINSLYGSKTPAKKFGGYTYYSEETAIMIKSIFDALHASPGNQQFWISDGIQPTTMYSQWYHGKRYLLEHLDPNGFYREFSQKIRCRKFVNRTQKGLVFSVRTKSVLRPIKLESVEKIPAWRQKLDDFIEKAVPGDKLKMDHLLLTEADQKEVQDVLAEDARFMHNMSAKHITIIRLSDNREAAEDECFGVGVTQ